MTVAREFPLKERTVVSILRKAVAENEDKVFVRPPASDPLTYGEFNRITNCCANNLSRVGLGKDGKIAIMAKNSLAFLHSWFAAAKLGAVYVPINTEYKGSILRHQLSKADVTHVVIDRDLAARLIEVMAELPKLEVVIIHDNTDDAIDLSKLEERFKVIAIDELYEGDEAEPEVDISYADPLAISFTSGTTGPSKGVLATNCHVVSFSLDWMKACQFTSEDRLFTSLPMFHAIASWLGVLPTIIAGTEFAFTERFSATQFWDDVRRNDSTVVHGVFSIIPMLLKQPPRDDDKDVPARLFYIGQRNQEFEDRFNCRIVEVYGATETGIVTYTPFDETSTKGSCGKANVDTYHVAIVDDDDNILPPGEVGEIVVRPSQPYSMIQEYYNMPNETLAAFRNLWFHTGDNGRMDEDGAFFFVDRKKDAMRRRGENISSYELEVVLNSDPRVAECAAIAVPSDLGEDEVKMVIVRADGATLSAEDVWALCEDQMPKFWVPRFIEFRDSLPKTPNQKIQKYLLRGNVDQGEMFDRETADV